MARPNQPATVLLAATTLATSINSLVALAKLPCGTQLQLPAVSQAPFSCSNALPQLCCDTSAVEIRLAVGVPLNTSQVQAAAEAVLADALQAGRVVSVGVFQDGSDIQVSMLPGYTA